jgi:hypothetical protein
MLSLAHPLLGYRYMKTLIVMLGTLVCSSSFASSAKECVVDGMKTLNRQASLKRGEIVAEVILEKSIVAKAGSTEVTLVSAADGTFTTVRFREPLTKDLVMQANSLLRLFAISDRQDNQASILNCRSDAGTCLHVDHPLVDTIAFSNEKVGLKQLDRAGVSVCIM